MKFYWLLLGILSVWRLTTLIGLEDGPWDVFSALRKSAGTGFLGRGLGCFYCLSLWIAIPFGLLIGETWFERILLWLACSAGAIILYRLTEMNYTVAPAMYVEDEEDENALLRTTKE